MDYLDKEVSKRSILVCGITPDIPLEQLLLIFQHGEISGGGPIQNYAFHDVDKLRITYFDRQGNNENNETEYNNISFFI